MKVFLRVVLLLCFTALLPAPTGYSEENLEKFMLAFDDFVSARFGCPPNWKLPQECNVDSGYFDAGAFLRARSHAKRLWDFKD